MTYILGLIRDIMNAKNLEIPSEWSLWKIHKQRTPTHYMV